MRLILFLFAFLSITTAVCAKTIQIQTPKQTHSFEVEIADTPEKSARGLMFRPSLAPDAGMIFISPKNQIWHMWMKNTVIPLDMLFFDRTGRIRKIATDTTPLDLTIISSEIPLAGVLELNAGTAATHQINVGDTITFSGLAAFE